MKKTVSFILAALWHAAMLGWAAAHHLHFHHRADTTAAEETAAAGRNQDRYSRRPDRRHLSRLRPMEFTDPTKQGQDMYVGFDVTLAKYIAESLGLELQIMPMSFDACQTAVYAGTVDMTISGFSWTEERTQNYNISNYYHAGDNEDEQVLITLASNGDKFTTADGLKGAKIGAQNASLRSPWPPSSCPTAS